MSKSTRAKRPMLAVTTGFEDAREADLLDALNVGRCIGIDPDVFFPEDPGHDDSEARAICGACLVRGQCLELTLRGPNVSGYRAGTSAIERRRMMAYRDPARSVRPSAPVSTTERAERYRALVPLLPADQRRVIELRFHRGLSRNAAAAELGRSTGALAQLERRAIGRLESLASAS
jgi:Transcription factor WhiB/Sigma-70, region 4